MIEHFAQPVYQRLALTLLHFVWQGAFIGLLLAVCLKLFRGSQLRYAACCGALLAIVIVPVLTFAMVESPNVATPNQVVASSEPANVEPVGPPAQPFGPVGLPEARHSPDQPVEVDEEDDASALGKLVAAIGPWCVLTWMLGTLFFGGRLLLGFAAVRRMVRDRSDLPEHLQDIVARLAKRLRLRTIPGVFVSERVRDAMAVGFFRPLVLLPMSWMTQLPPEVLRSVIAHELAHIRRCDQWVNLLQRVVESILFYHPAVWWISNRTRAEREYRCDELALAAAGGAEQYAEALERVARFRLFEREPLLANSLGGTRMALLKRVKHVLGMSDSPRGRTWWAVGLLAVCLPALILATTVWRSDARADDAAFVDGDEEKREADEKRRTDKRGEERERRERAERREGEERERAERRRGEERRERGNRREGDRREGDRPRGEGRERDRPRGERREGDRRERGERRGEERRRDGDRREGERRREGDRREPVRRRDGDRREPPRGGGNLRELLEAIRQLRNEVSRLRKEVDELKGRRPRRDGDRGDGPPRRRDGDARPPRRGDGDGFRPPRKGERDRPKRPAGERDRPRKREGDRPRN